MTCKYEYPERYGKYLSEIELQDGEYLLPKSIGEACFDPEVFYKREGNSFITGTAHERYEYSDYYRSEDNDCYPEDEHPFLIYGWIYK